MRRGDGWADGVFEVFSEEYGGSIIVDVRYSAESIEFSDELDEIESVIRETGSDVGLLVLSFAEAEEIVNQASEYPVLFTVP